MGRCLRSPAMHCAALRNTPAPHCRPLRNSTGKQCAGADFSDDPFLACISPPWPSVGADAPVHPPTLGKLLVLHPWGRCLHRPALPATDLSVGAGFYPARPMAAAPLAASHSQVLRAPRRAGCPHPAAPYGLLPVSGAQGSATRTIRSGPAQITLPSVGADASVRPPSFGKLLVLHP